MIYSLSTGFAIYFVLWWIVLFAVLPFGVRSQMENGEEIAGTDPGAPSVARMGRKLLWTTVISAVIFAAGMAVFKTGYLNVERLTKLMGVPL
jgi:predicted secreted protein